MKKLLILMIAFFSACTSMQETPPEMLNTPMVKVYDFKGMSQGAIFDKSLAWIAESYGSAKEVIQLSDKANGKIIGQCVGKVFFSYGAIDMGADRGFTYTLKIDVKNGKARIAFENIQQRITTATDLYGKPYEVVGIQMKYVEQYKLVLAYFEKATANYETYIKTTTTF